MFYNVYQKIFTRGTYSSGGNGSARCIDSAFLLYGDTAPDYRIRGGMDRMPLCDAARRFQDISVSTAPGRHKDPGSPEDRIRDLSEEEKHEGEKSVSFCCHPRTE